MCYLPESFYKAEPRYTLKELEKNLESEKILSGRAVLFDKEKTLHIKLGINTVLIPLQETAEGIADGLVREVAVVSRIGHSVAFVLTQIDYSTHPPLLYGSRAKAQALCRRNYIERLSIGDILNCTVTHIEPFGAFCDIGCGISALLPIDALSVSRIESPFDRVFVGEKLHCAVKNRDENGRILLSLKELLGSWEENAAAFEAGTSVVGIVRTIEPYGAFIELSPNLAGLAEPVPALRTGETVSVYIKSIIKEKMKIKLVILQRLGEEPPSSPLHYFITEGHLSHWQYSPGECVKKIVTDFV